MDVFGIIYHIENPQQFWSGALFIPATYAKGELTNMHSVTVFLQSWKRFSDYLLHRHSHNSILH